MCKQRLTITEVRFEVPTSQYIESCLCYVPFVLSYHMSNGVGKMFLTIVDTYISNHMASNFRRP